MQIEPPETIHFPIHSLQELQEQRGGLRVSALGPLRHRRMGVLNPGSTSLRRASAKLNGRAAALAGPLGFYSTFCLCARWCGGDSPQASSIIIIINVINNIEIYVILSIIYYHYYYQY